MRQAEPLTADIKLLVIAYVFPPVGEVGGHRVAKFCRYLPEYGIEPMVVTVQPELYRYRDASVRPPEGIRLVRTGMLRTPLEHYRRWKSGRAAGAEPGAAEPTTPSVGQEPGALRRHLLTLLQTPDAHWGWYFPAVRAAEKLLREEPMAAMLSTAPPWTAHWIARHLKKKHKLPWLADFRDPWSTDHGDVPHWKHNLDVRMEASCVRLADRVLCNTDRLRQFFVKLYAGEHPEKFLTLPNGFDDPAVPLTPSPAPKQRRLFLHIGWLYAERRVDTFCEAVGNLVRNSRLDPSSFRVLFLGDTDPALAESARQKAPELFEQQCIEFHPRIPWMEAQQVLASADVLLLFQGNWALEIPLKFFEYFPTGKPIFAVVCKGALSDLVESTGVGMWAPPESPDEIATQFLRVLQQPARSPDEVREQWYERYHFRSLAGQLAEHIRGLLPAK